MRAKVYLVGAGPGDPDLLTRKAYILLQQADVVIYDRLVSDDVLTLVNPSATLFYAGKSRGQQQAVQAEICYAFLRFAQTANCIVRLKGGDPTVFGRSGEELAFLNHHGIPCEVVPGVSSALAAPALTGIPLTLRNVATSFTVIAGHRSSVDSINWTDYRRIDTIVVLMGVENRALIARKLLAAGRSPLEPVAFIEHASSPSERVVETTLDALSNGGPEVHSPAVMVIGDVVAHRAAVCRGVQPLREHGPRPIKLAPPVASALPQLFNKDANNGQYRSRHAD